MVYALSDDGPIIFPSLLCFFPALLDRTLRFRSRMLKTLPGHNASLLQDPDETLLLETTTRGDDLIPPPDTAPTAMTAALIVEPAGDVEQEFRRANHYVTGAMPGRSGKRKQRPSIWNL